MICFIFEQGNLSAHFPLQNKNSYICFENLKPQYQEIDLFLFLKITYL